MPTATLLEICFLESGKQKYTVEGKSYDLVGGDLFVTFPDEMHSTGGTPQEKGMLFWLLLFAPQARRPYLGLFPTAEGRRLFKQLCYLPRSPFPRHKIRKENSLQNIFSAFNDIDNPLRLIGLKNLLLRFLLDVLDSSRDSQSAISPTIRKVQKFIAANSDTMLSLRQLAQIADLSQSRLKARFKGGNRHSSGRLHYAAQNRQGKTPAEKHTTKYNANSHGPGILIDAVFCRGLQTLYG